uniref:HTH psq-type domain-containing protein n=1 Tax=Graphocephala atropunctata TaxID=36148 RepID=A0A1B6KBL0_9HEMI
MFTNKRKRVVLTIHQKLEIIEHLEKGRSAKSVANEYNVGEQTVKDLKKKKMDLLKFASAAESSLGLKKRKKMKKATFKTLDKAMLDWFTQQRSMVIGGLTVISVICGLFPLHYPG